MGLGHLQGEQIRHPSCAIGERNSSRSLFQPNQSLAPLRFLQHNLTVLFHADQGTAIPQNVDFSRLFHCDGLAGSNDIAEVQRALDRNTADRSDDCRTLHTRYDAVSSSPKRQGWSSGITGRHRTQRGEPEQRNTDHHRDANSSMSHSSPCFIRLRKNRLTTRQRECLQSLDESLFPRIMTRQTSHHCRIVGKRKNRGQAGFLCKWQPVEI